jgi:hypothetical protein
MSTAMPKKLRKCFAKLLEDEWKFLDKPWPLCPKTKKFHRSDMKPVENIQRMKELLMHHLGAIPVFFFLSVIWAKFYFPGPYKAVDKGIAFLYYFVAGQTMDSMSQYLPRTSFYQLYDTFFDIQIALFDKFITQCLANMFSTPEIRVRSANWKNPPLFKHITLLLDGHDTRATYGENKIDMFSYKLHKSGLRTQVCIDINGVALFVSMSEACKDNNDGTMLVAMNIGNKIQEVDCIGLDGGYTQHIGKILEQDHQLTLMNFCFPIHKKRLQPLHAEEANFNSMFGAFRSMVENTFSELGTAFNKHNNKDPIRVNSKKAFNLNLRLCLLLLNIKKFVNILQIQELPHHRSWMEDGFDYPTDKKIIPDLTETYTVQNKLEYGDEMLKVQEAFLSMDMDESGDENVVDVPGNKRLLLESVEIPARKK